MVVHPTTYKTSTKSHYYFKATFLLPDVSTEAVTLILSFLLTGSLDTRSDLCMKREMVALKTIRL